MRICHSCEGDGYTETWNDDQSGVVIEPCNPCAATGWDNAGIEIEPPGAFDTRHREAVATKEEPS